MVYETNYYNKDATPSKTTERENDFPSAKAVKVPIKVLKGLTAILMVIFVLVFLGYLLAFGILYKCPVMNNAILKMSIVNCNSDAMIWKLGFVVFAMVVTGVITWQYKKYKHVDEWKNLPKNLDFLTLLTLVF